MSKIRTKSCGLLHGLRSESFYDLPKIHNPGVPLRPIVSSVGTIVHNIARFLVPILGPIELHIKDSRQFSQEVRELSLEPGEVMTSYDVKSLFTCILPQGVLEAVQHQLEEDEDVCLKRL